MNIARHKGSTTTALVAVLAVVVVGGVGWYLASDVFRTKVDAGIRQGTTWTPENIAKDPVNYLNYVEAETSKALDSLKASRIAIAMSKADLTSKGAEAKNKVAVGKKAVNELLQVYKDADAANVWPASYNGQPHDKNWVQVNVVSLQKQVNQQQGLADQIDLAMSKLEAQTGKIDDAETKAREQLAEIGVNRETLKLQAITDDLSKKLASMQSVVQATAGIAAENKQQTISLDQLAAQSSKQVDNTEFDKILANSSK